ncbi:winged helix-turn-helix domain-containing protein [Hydrocarboniphaga sp.]|uniref:winged helix-turn-helix domain-containing protein n=1 Tax=Hydrocarboniphaga sp. TaxID=2033016 RepID=UPI00262CFB2D|nr:winged helix-turn-helix domain-containing protein [Hydrocarboniphaga sp.]
MSGPASGDGAAPPRYRIGDWQFDLPARALQRGERIEHLPLKVALVLQQLAEQPGAVLPRERLIARIWDGNDYTGPRGLTNAIWQLRRLLDDDAAADTASAIETIAKTGYRLSLPAQRVPAAEAAAAIDAATVEPPVISAASSSRPRLLIALSGLVALLAAAVLAITLAPRRAAPTALLKAEPLTVYDGVEEFPNISTDGRWLAFSWEKNERPSQIYVKDLQDPQAPPRRISRDESLEELRPVWSADGRAIALVQLQPDGACRILIRELAAQQDRSVAECFYERLHQVMDWSPDGRTLAIARKDERDDAVAIVLHPLDGSGERRLTQPADDAQDSQLAWSHDGRRIAFIRRSVNIGELYVIDVASGREQRLTDDGMPMFGLAWLPGDEALVFNTMRNGGFASLKIDAGGGRAEPYAAIDAPFNMAAIPGTHGGLAISQHRSAEHIEIWRPNAAGGAGAAPTMLGSLSSTGRELYAQWSAYSDRLIFMSTRSGRVELWTSNSDGSDTRPVPALPGLPGAMCWSPVDGRYAVALRPDGGRHDLLYIGATDRDAPQLVVDDGHDYQNPSWQADGLGLIVASNRGGNWDLWRWDTRSHEAARLTDDGGIYGQIADDGWLYYARSSQTGLWRRRPGAQSAREPVLADLGKDDWGNWQVLGSTLYYIARTADHDRVIARNLVDGNTRTLLELPRNAIRIYHSLSVTSDGRVVLTILGRRQADIVALRPS